MAVEFPIEDALAALRSRMIEAWGMVEGTDPILETGDDPIRDDDMVGGKITLPIGIIQVGEAPVSVGPSARSRTLTLPLLLWLVMRKQAGTRAVVTLREKLQALQELIYDDQHLGGVVMNIEVTGLDWGGMTDNAPIDLPDPSGGALAGYVAVTVQIAGGYAG